MSQLLRDLRFAGRSLRQRPAYFVVAVLTLALGLGANSLIFSVVEATLLRPLPYGEAHRLVTVWSQWVDFPKTWVSQGEVAAYRDTIDSFEAVAAFGRGQATLELGEVAERVPAVSVTRNLLDVVGLEPALGRAFTEQEAQQGAPVIMIGHELWQRRLGGEKGVLGRPIVVDGVEMTVVGVLPAGLVLPQDFSDGRATQVWAPMADPAPFTGLPPNGGSHGLYALARLAPGATLEEARAEVAAFNRWTTQEGYYTEEWGFRTLLVPAEEEVTGSVRPALFVLAGAVGLVLLIACANLANLCLSQALRRQQELALRTALGAGRWSLARLLLAESLIIGVAGGALGLAIAFGGLPALKALAAGEVPRLATATLNAPVLLFTALATLGAAFLFGLAPALWAGRRTRDLRAGFAHGGGKHWSQGLAVATQVALAVVLLTGTGLMVRTFHELLTRDPGFDRQRVLTFRMDLPQAHYPEDQDVTGFYRDTLAELRSLPGVEAAGAIRWLPLATPMGDYGIVVEGYEPAPQEQPAAEWQSAAPGYFEAMGIPLAAGRTFADGDDQEGAPVMIVNEAFVRRYFPDASGPAEALGRRVRLSGQDKPWTNVVGVVTDVAHTGLTDAVKPRWYLPMEQFHRSTNFASRGMTAVLRMEGGGTTATALLPQVRRLLQQRDSRLALSDVATMNEVVGSSVSTTRLATALLGTFSALALLLAAVGIYGVTAALVARRRREVGIRLSLGALPRQAVALMLSKGAAPIALGLAAGLVAAFFGSRLLAGLLYGVGTRDPLTFLAAPVLIAAAGLVACWLPARRAARVDPRIVLKES